MKVKTLYLSEITTGNNPRKRFEGIEELAESIKLHGLLQPIVVGKKNSDGLFPIIAGERRYRALSMLAEMQEGELDVHCVIRADEEAYELSIIENLQRQDVPPLQEAQAFWELRKQGLDTLDIAHRVGKSASFVYNRLQLNELIDPLKELLDKEVLPISYALQLARLSKEGQAKAQSMVVKPFSVPGEDGTRNQRIAIASKEVLSNAIRSASCASLSKAPFSLEDADTFANAGGPCTTCHKRTRNSSGLFQDIIGSQDLCLDGSCFQNKIEVHYQLEKQKLEEPAAAVVTSVFNMPAPASARPFTDYAGKTFVEKREDCEKPMPMMYIGQFEPYIRYLCGCGNCGHEQPEAQPEPTKQHDTAIESKQELEISEEEKARRLQELNDLPFGDEEEEQEPEVLEIQKVYKYFHASIAGMTDTALVGLLAIALYENHFSQVVKGVDWYNEEGEPIIKKHLPNTMAGCFFTANNYINSHGQQKGKELLSRIQADKLEKYMEAQPSINGYIK